MKQTNRISLVVLSIIVIAVGIGSRIIQTGWPIWDKYVGDALYAVLLYLILRLPWNRGNPGITALVATGLMLVIETFQLTGVALRLSASSNVILRLLSIVLGTTFGWPDIIAYFIGIWGIYWLDRYVLWHEEK